MGTLKGFPNPPALWLWRAKPAFAHAMMGTEGFPNPPALWLWRAKPAFAYAMMGTEGFASLFGPPPATTTPSLRSALPNPAALPLD
jgi:hypothetical protein